MLLNLFELGCWSSEHRNLYRYQVSSFTMFFFVSYMHIHIPIIMYCSRLFVVVFQEINCFHAFKHDVVRRVTELHLSTTFLYQVSCLLVLRLVSNASGTRKRRILKFQFKTFPSHQSCRSLL